MNKLQKLLLPVLGIIGVLLMLFTFPDFEKVGSKYVCIKCWPVDSFLRYSYLLLLASIILAFASSAKSMMANPKTIKGALVGVIGLAAVFLISYLMSGDEVLKTYGDVSPTVSKLSGMGLYAFYILFLGSFAAIIYSSIIKFTK
jgi:hypothetical protein